MTETASAPELASIARDAKAWPFEEAKKLLKRLERVDPNGEKTVIFQTGYGPSGLPHIGTFGEVSRTTMVRTAFHALTGGARKTRLICFSDDLDGLRKVPDNVPNKEMLSEYLNQPLSTIPDPFGDEHPSFAAHNNARLMAFLDQFGFDYEFYSATECYRSGMMDATLLKMLAVYDKVMDIILPTIGPDRQATYSPFLPICERTGHVLQVPMVARDADAGTITYVDPETGDEVTTPVTGGRVKCQWKADWAMRWTALGVDYEMSGKDLIDSVTLSSRICKALGGTPPEGFNYELFLDEKGEKISKSKGNGLTIDEWLTYASPESLSLFMFQKPKSAKKLYFDVIPKAVDEYLTFLGKFGAEAPDKQIANPVWHVHAGTPPNEDAPVTFALLLNLVSASNAETKETLWGFIKRYAPETSAETHPTLDRLAGYALVYYRDFVLPTKTYRAPSPEERSALEALVLALENAGPNATAEELQNIVYAVGKDNGFADNLRDWFRAIYEVLLGQSAGPRFGGFIALYGRDETIAMIGERIDG
ncbi:MAG: lysine--tRNA ligase [Pseudomonadota bacterium]